jgi:hypothetical protein
MEDAQDHMESVLMRLDQRGNPDVCRTIYTPVEREPAEVVLEIKLCTNSLINICNILLQRNQGQEVRRLLAMAITDFENASDRAVKALTSEGVSCPLVIKGVAEKVRGFYERPEKVSPAIGD